MLRCGVLTPTAPGKFWQRFRQLIFKLILVSDDSCEVAVGWISLNLRDDKSTSVKVMVWCRQATKHYISLCWPSSMPPYVIPRPQWLILSGAIHYSRVPNNRQLDRLFNILFMLTSKKTSKLRIAGRCDGNPPANSLPRATIWKAFACHNVSTNRFYHKQMTTFGSSDETWWLHQMATFSALLALCAGNSPVTGEFPTQRPVTRSFDVFFDLRLNKRLSKQSWGWWFETPSRSLWRHCNLYFKKWRYFPFDIRLLPETNPINAGELIWLTIYYKRYVIMKIQNVWACLYFYHHKHICIPASNHQAEYIKKVNIFGCKTKQANIRSKVSATCDLCLINRNVYSADFLQGDVNICVYISICK